MTTTTTPHPDSKPIDKFIPWMIVAFFVVVAAVNAVFVTLAIRTLPGTVVEHPYEEGIEYNKIIADEARQNALGWSGKISYADGTLRFILTGKDGDPLEGAKVKAKIERPISDGYDRDIQLTDKGDGIYEAGLRFPLPGLWNARIFSVWNGTPFQADTDLEIR